jgi:hypothetical protein
MKAKPGIEAKTDAKHDSKVGAAKTHVHHVIDTVLSTMYANDAFGYQGVDARVFKSEAIKKIQRELETLDKKTRTHIEPDIKYRLEEFRDFSHLPDQLRQDVLRLAKERRISIEQAYKEKRR